MKLWEEMLVGSMGTKQITGQLVDEAGNTCAIGAVMDAIGVLRTARYSSLLERWPFLRSAATLPPGTKGASTYCGMVNVWKAIVLLNNENGWSRERIALEFIKPIEEALTVTPQPEPMKEEICA